MGAVNQQELYTGSALIQAGVASYIDGVALRSVAKVSDGVFLLTFASSLSMLEQFPTPTVLGTDPTADAQVEVVGGGPSFNQLNLRTYVARVPTDVDVYFLLEKVRTIQ